MKKHISQEELQGRLVCCIANLKAAKLAGLASEGMMLAAVQPHADGSELVIPLLPPGAATVPSTTVRRNHPYWPITPCLQLQLHLQHSSSYQLTVSGMCRGQSARGQDPPRGATGRCRCSPKAAEIAAVEGCAAGPASLAGHSHVQVLSRTSSLYSVLPACSPGLFEVCLRGEVCFVCICVPSQ